MISVVDYGLGNVQAFVNIYKHLDQPVRLATSANDLETADKIILPGVGAFDRAMQMLDASGMRDALEDCATQRNMPVLGICVGMQMLARRSDEGERDGLGWLDGEVRRFEVAHFTQKTHLPHMGWNDVAPVEATGLFHNLGDAANFYFLHSYYMLANNPENTLAVTEYGGKFCSAIGSGNIFGVQFHPEKSHQWGIQLLKNFGEL